MLMAYDELESLVLAYVSMHGLVIEQFILVLVILVFLIKEFKKQSSSLLPKSYQKNNLKLQFLFSVGVVGD